GNVGETDSKTVAQETGPGWHSLANGREGFITARCGDAISLLEQGVFRAGISSAPLDDFQAGAQFGFDLVKRMREQTRQQRCASGALYKLGCARQQAEGDVE